MPAGRPTIYEGQKTIDKVDEYLLTCGEEEDIFHKTRGDASNGYERVWKVKLPKLETFALYLGVNKDTIVDWESKYPEFSVALDKIRLKQHDMLIDGATSGRYNSTISKLILSSNHGYKERNDTTSDDKPIQFLPTEVIAKLNDNSSPKTIGSN